MKKLSADLSRLIPIGRETAAEIALAASHFHSTLTLERDGIVLNLKSMIGLLSQSIPEDGRMTLVASGEDEQEAVETLSRIISL